MAQLPPPVLPPPLAPRTPSAPTAPAWWTRVNPIAAAAIAGAVLIAVAAVILTAGRWDAISNETKVAGLIVATMFVVAVGERRRLPTTSRVFAHLGVTLVGPAAIALAAYAGGTWPWCVLSGGTAAAAAGLAQRGRWKAWTFGTLSSGAICLGTAGLAALTDIPIGVIAALGAAALLATKAERSAVEVSVAALAAPLLSGLAALKVGPGTLERVGAAGSDLAWAAPLAGLIAAAVLVILGTRKRTPLLSAVGGVGFLLNGLTGLSFFDIGAAGWVTVACSALLIVELAALLPGASMAATFLAPLEKCAVALVWLAFPIAVLWSLETDLASDARAHRAWALPFVILTAGLFIAMLARRVSITSPLVGTLAAPMIWFAANDFGLTVGLSIAAAVVAAVCSKVPAAALIASAVAVMSATAIHGESVVAAAWGLVAVAALTSVVLATRQTHTWLRMAETTTATGGLMLMLGDLVPTHSIGVIAAACAVLLGTRIGRSADAALALSLLGCVAHEPFQGGWSAAPRDVAIALCLAAATLVQRRKSLYLATIASASFAVVGLATGLGWSAADTRGTLLAFGLAALATSIVTPKRWEELAAVSVGAALASSWFFVADPWVNAAAGVAIGLAAVRVGFATSRHHVTAVGAAAALLSAINLIDITNAPEWLDARLAPYGYATADFALVVLSIVCIAAGMIFTKRRADDEAIDLIGFGILAIWSIGHTLERAQAPQVGAGLVVATVAVAVAAVLGRRPLLLAGLGLGAVTIIAASWESVTHLPIWAMFALGGAALLAVAVWLERKLANREPVN